MRIRRLPWARPELAASPMCEDMPLYTYGEWHDQYKTRQPLHLELGMGKGGFLAAISVDHPEWNFLGIDIKSEMLALARRKIDAAHEEKGLVAADHVRICSHDIERIGMMLGPEDVVDAIYINFCNPWPTGKDQKKRLTHTRQLLKYRSFLKDGGEVFFKTDDMGLFDDSLVYFEKAGYRVDGVTRDLWMSDIPNPYPTEHEKMFREKGLPIYRLHAVKLPDSELPELDPLDTKGTDYAKRAPQNENE